MVASKLSCAFEHSGMFAQGLVLNVQQAAWCRWGSKKLLDGMKSFSPEVTLQGGQAIAS